MLDTQHQVEAPEGIFLSVRPAGFTSRAKAFLIDFGLRIGILLAALPLLNAAGHLGQGMLMVVAFALEWLYPVCFELMAGGATPGKRAAGLRVVMDDGLPVTLAASVTRNLLRVAETVRLSRRTHAVLWQNITLALGIKSVFLVLAVFGTATMWMAVFADMGASLLVIGNGLRLLRQRTRQ